MLSVLIPTYNYKCYTLVHDLQQQLEATNVEYEILVAEDGGKDQVAAISNHRINDLPHCHYIRRQHNVGRAAIRNYLADESKGDWLLFMDSDGLIIRKDFVQKYIDAINEGHDVVCGGIFHSDRCPSKQQSLRWKYEKVYELRYGNVGKTFRSFAFTIRRSIFDKVRFCEEYRWYGWEDVQFGNALEALGAKVYCIDNPLENKDIETNVVFLKKTEEAMRTLSDFSDELSQSVGLLKFVNKIDRMHLSWLFSLTFRLTKPLLRRNLLGKSPNLRIFAFYKLGYYLNNRRKH